MFLPTLLSAIGTDRGSVSYYTLYVYKTPTVGSFMSDLDIYTVIFIVHTTVIKEL